MKKSLSKNNQKFEKKLKQKQSKVLYMCTHICMCMGTKTISIMDDAYDLLVRNRRKGESFSSVIRRIAEKKKDIMEFAGIWKNKDDEEIEEVKENIIKFRKKATSDLLRKIKDDKY